ncbi:uncharacterized protein LOC143152617 isoform X2 [Ptiloglossa arizonensis]|uniref:uncharacterized protein LOC143152617 isoform X2 n=1 Tax=Ptiloglossa arizonensis TaxID=3350558 RepID=UPI003FA055C8
MSVSRERQQESRDHNESLDCIPVSPVYTARRSRGRTGERQQTRKKDENHYSVPPEGLKRSTPRGTDSWIEHLERSIVDDRDTPSGAHFLNNDTQCLARA